MRSRMPFFALLLVVSSLSLPLVVHAGTDGGIPFFGPIIPPDNPLCPLGWGMLIQVINRIISLLLTLAIVFVAPIMIAYSGFLFVVNPVNPSGISRAREVLINTVVGIVIALAAWMIVDAIMAALYNPSATSGNTTLTTWQNLITGNSSDVCLSQLGAAPGAGLNQAGPGGPGVATTAQRPDDRTTTELNATNGACNPATITAAVSSVSSTNANRLACIAKGESSCGGTRQANYNVNYSFAILNSDGLASSAAGAYQVLLSSNSSCYDKAVCEQAAGTPGTALNCSTAFQGNGMPLPGTYTGTPPNITPNPSTTLEKCLKAAGNVACSATAAVCLLQERNQSFTAAYGTDPYVQSCMTKYP